MLTYNIIIKVIHSLSNPKDLQSIQLLRNLTILILLVQLQCFCFFICFSSKINVYLRLGTLDYLSDSGVSKLKQFFFRLHSETLVLLLYTLLNPIIPKRLCKRKFFQDVVKVNYTLNLFSPFKTLQLELA